MKTLSLNVIVTIVFIIILSYLISLLLQEHTVEIRSQIFINASPKLVAKNLFDPDDFDEFHPFLKEWRILNKTETFLQAEGMEVIDILGFSFNIPLKATCERKQNEDEISVKWNTQAPLSVELELTDKIFLVTSYGNLKNIQGSVVEEVIRIKSLYMFSFITKSKAEYAHRVKKEKLKYDLETMQHEWQS